MSKPPPDEIINVNIDNSTTNTFNGVNFSWNNYSSHPTQQQNGASARNKTHHGQRSYCHDENSLRRGSREQLSSRVPSLRPKYSMYHTLGRPSGHCRRDGLQHIEGDTISCPKLSIQRDDEIIRKRSNVMYLNNDHTTSTARMHHAPRQPLHHSEVNGLQSNGEMIAKRKLIECEGGKKRDEKKKQQRLN